MLHGSNRAAVIRTERSGFSENVTERSGADFVAFIAVSYTHLRAHETREDLVCRLLLEKKSAERILTVRFVKPHRSVGISGGGNPLRENP